MEQAHAIPQPPVNMRVTLAHMKRRRTNQKKNQDMIDGSEARRSLVDGLLGAAFSVNIK